MERLTFRGHKGQSILKGTACNYSGVSYDCQLDEGIDLLKAAFEKLAEYEDAEEQELLLKLPCKVGDTLYRIDTDENIENAEIEPYTIENIVISNWGDILFKYDAYDGIICALENITKGSLYLGFYRVFLTKEEAEQALAEMKEV